MSDDDKRAGPIDAVARQRVGGEPADYARREAVRFVDDLRAALPHLVTSGSPEILEARSGERTARYRRDDNA